MRHVFVKILTANELKQRPKSVDFHVSVTRERTRRQLICKPYTLVNFTRNLFQNGRNFFLTFAFGLTRIDLQTGSQNQFN